MNDLNKTRRKPRQISFRVAVLLAEIIAVSTNTIKGTVSFPTLGSANRSESGNSLQLKQVVHCLRVNAIITEINMVTMVTLLFGASARTKSRPC